jgi:nitrogen-specific signal transduction histidine kinase
MLPESMLTLAVGMADDFNNILTTVMGACSLIERDKNTNSELFQYVELIRSSAERAAKLSSRLIYASTHELEYVSPIDLNRLTGKNATSVRDKKTKNGIVSSNDHSGGSQNSE